uniref:Transcription elongation factor Spt4 n=1 Tax=uncultured marine thaumarchaeote KM3_198_G09 TaxID=1456089 RepID=A0A075GVP5_9ARCH|nr:DNA-directed RNA polymerase, subunit E'' (rpoE2) [uncultured marine thaumarchaeote KM3_198_G09]
MVKELACRKCKCITIGKVCPACKSSDLTPDWEGVVIIANPKESRIAQTLKISVEQWKIENPKYALKVT